MIDYLLKFPSKSAAEQFGVGNGFAAPDEDGVLQTSLASHEHALCVIGDHEGQYWVLFRDLIGIPIPAGGEQFIHWTSTSGVTRPTDDPAVPNTFWC